MMEVAKGQRDRESILGRMVSIAAFLDSPVHPKLIDDHFGLVGECFNQAGFLVASLQYRANCL